MAWLGRRLRLNGVSLTRFQKYDVQQSFRMDFAFPRSEGTDTYRVVLLDFV
jgi:hypothetical protein